MTSPEFVIEGVFEGGDGRCYVLTRAVDPALEFMIPSDARLGGCPIEQWLEVPRALDANGQQRRDVYGFRLRQASDRSRLIVGATVVLVGG
jgi:hypothetical protein